MARKPRRMEACLAFVEAHNLSSQYEGAEEAEAGGAALRSRDPARSESRPRADGRVAGAKLDFPYDGSFARAAEKKGECSSSALCNWTPNSRKRISRWATLIITAVKITMLRCASSTWRGKAYQIRRMFIWRSARSNNAKGISPIRLRPSKRRLRWIRTTCGRYRISRSTTR